MKKLLFYHLILLLLFASCTSFKTFLTTDTTLPVNKRITDTKGRTQLIGITTRQGLQQAPFNEWFQKNYDDYQPNPKVIAKCKSKTKGVEILAFMGTWCGDSKRGVPQVYKILDEIHFDEKKLKLVNVYSGNGKTKQSPNGEEKGLNIHHVPTFIFYKKGKEIGRIVEKPVTNFETDIAQILNGLATQPKYKVISDLNHLIKNKGLAHLEKKKKFLGRYTAYYSKSSGELNTYGYVLLDAGKIDEAIMIFKINTIAYPNVANTFDSLGEAYLKAGNKKLAIENYQKVLEIEPDNKSAKTVLEKIKNS